MPIDLHPAMVGAVEPDYEMLANAVYRAEGGDKAKAPYGILSVDVKGDADKARRIAISTFRNNYGRWIKAGKPGSYLEFLADKYVPPKADPAGNTRWKKNVPAIYAQLAGQSVPVPLPPYNPALRKIGRAHV